MSDNRIASQDQPPIIALNLRRIDKGNTLASVSLLFPQWEGLRIHGVLWGKKREGAEWVLPPSRTWTSPSGTTTRAHLIEWGDQKAGQRIQKAAIDAIHRLVKQEKAKAGG